MRRQRLAPRPGWQAIVESQGLKWHTDGEERFWNESAAYILTRPLIQRLCQTARELAQIYRAAADHIVKKRLWSRIGLSDKEAQVVAASWERGDWSLHGRFDFLLDHEGCPRLIEYNAETALSLVESARVQRQWLADVMPGLTQHNELEQRLVDAWRGSGFKHVHCVWRPRHAEVEGTVIYMTEIIRKAGIRTTMQAMHRIGWDHKNRTFVDQDGIPISHCYKLYPWEWMLREPFAKFVDESHCAFVEPPWRLILGSKGILCVMSELFPDHPSIVPCRDSPENLGRCYVCKPMFGHEGHNVSIYQDGIVTASQPGEYGDESLVYQAFIESPRYEGHLPQIGVWMVHDEPAAICVRETRGSIISADSPFVPHALE